MGYTTTFEGKFEFNRQLTPKEYNFINQFNRTRHFKRNMDRYFENPDVFGVDGEFFVLDSNWKLMIPYKNMKPKPVMDYTGKRFKTLSEFYQQVNRDSIVDSNNKASDCPGLWCQWRITSDRKFLTWDGSEKFYSYVEWLRYLVNNFFDEWDVQMTGVMYYSGERADDHGKICAYHNWIKVYEDKHDFNLTPDICEDILKSHYNGEC